MDDKALKEQIDEIRKYLKKELSGETYVKASDKDEEVFIEYKPTKKALDRTMGMIERFILQDRERAVKEARLDELKQLWNNTQPEIVPEGVVAHDMSEALHKRMKKLNVIWYNVRFNFSYWLLGAKSMKVVRKNEKR